MDDVDIAEATETLFRDTSIMAQLDKNNEAKRPVDHNGICIDCGIDINPIRIEAVQAVRCIDCQKVHEAIKARYAR